VLILIIALLLPFPILRFFLTRNVLETGQGRHILYPAAQSIPILIILGWVTASAGASQRVSEATNKPAPSSTLHLFIWPLLLLIWSIFQFIYMATTYPDPLPVQTTTFNPATIPQPLKQNFGDDIQFLGYDFIPDPEQAIINLTLYWQSLNPVDENYRTQVQLLDSEGQPHFTWLSHPLNGRYPTRAWDKGDVFRDELPLPLAAVPPNNYSIQIDLLREAEDTSLTAEPVQIIQFNLPARQPIADASTLENIDYRLWVEDAPVRQRQTLALSWMDNDQTAQVAAGKPSLDWFLVGPDDIPRSPAAISDATAMFIVGADWPSGDYRLQLHRTGFEESHQTESLLTVANEARLFSLPEGVEASLIPVEASFANSEGQPQIKLLGYILPTRRVEAGGGLPLTLYWQSLEPVLGDYIVFDVLLAENQQAYGGYDRLPREYYSTILWAEGEVVEDGFAVPVSPAAPPGIYYLHVGLYSLATGSPVSLAIIENGQVTDVTSVDIGPIKVGGPPPDVVVSNPAPQVTLQQSFGHQITLLGYDLSNSDGQPLQNATLNTQNLKLTLYWRADAIPEANYTTFLHLRNSANENAAQKDRPPANGRYPTSLWDVGEIIVDELTLSLADLPAGEYTPVLGLYDFTTDIRLPIEGIPANELHLGRVIVP
jgi:hypothetical protein